MNIIDLFMELLANVISGLIKSFRKNHDSEPLDEAILSGCVWWISVLLLLILCVVALFYWWVVHSNF